MVNLDTNKNSHTTSQERLNVHGCVSGVKSKDYPTYYSFNLGCE